MKNIFIFLFLCLFTVLAFAQPTYNMQTAVVTNCIGVLYDDGGFNDNYSVQVDSEPKIFTICPGNTSCLVMDFELFVTENTSFLGDGDVLTIYDGPDTNSPIIGTYDGILVNNENFFGRVTSGSGCLTLSFVENGAFTTLGWEATWSCYAEDCMTTDNLNAPIDCVDAIVVCGEETLIPNTGEGVEELEDFEINGCLQQGESFPTWIEINISPFAPANIPLTFTILPLPEAQDYDFAIYGPNTDCANLLTPIRCSYAEEEVADTLATGLKIGETDISETATVDNEENVVNGFVAPIVVNPGEQYYLLVNNFSQDGIGFSIIWGEEVVSNNLLDCTVCNHFVLMPDDFEVCAGDTFEVSPIIHSGSGFFDYQWSASVPDVSFEGESSLMVDLPTGFTGEVTFTLLVTDLEAAANCVYEEEITVNVFSPYDFVGATIASSACIGEEVELVLEGDFGENAVITWDLGTGNLIGGDVGTLGPLSVEWETEGIKTIDFSLSNADFEDCSFFTYQFETEILPTVEQPFISCPNLEADSLFTWEAVLGAEAYEVLVVLNGEDVAFFTTDETAYALAGVVDGDEVSISVNSIPSEGFCASSLSNTKLCIIQTCSLPGGINFVNLSTIYCQAADSVELIVEPEGGILTIDGELTNILNPSDLGVGEYQILYQYTLPENGCIIEVQEVFEVVEIFETPIINCQSNSATEVHFDWNDVGADTYTLEIRINDGDSLIVTISDNFYTVGELVANDAVEFAIIEMTPLDCFGGDSVIQSCQSEDCPFILTDITGLSDTYCESDEFIVLTGIPEGGVFSGEYISDNQFNILEAGEGLHGIFYTYISQETGCTYSAIDAIEVLASLDAPMIACSEMTEEGMTFNWNEVDGALGYKLRVFINGMIFKEPTIQGLSYSVENLTFGDEVTVEIYAIGVPPCIKGLSSVNTCIFDICPEIELNIIGLENSYCSNDSPVELLGNLSEGVFTFNGVEIAEFDPSMFPIGGNVLVYEYEDLETGCVYAIDQTIEVIAAPTAPIPSCMEVATNQIVFGWNALEEAISYAVNYSINGGDFTELNLPKEEISYTLGGLTAGDEVLFEIAANSDTCGMSEFGEVVCIANNCPSLVVNFQNLATTYCSNDAPILLTANPSGGMFTINGIDASEFDPSMVDIGGNTIRYEYTDSETNCLYSVEETVEVIAPPATPVPVCTNVLATRMTFEWEAIEGADNYELSYSANGELLKTVILQSTVTSYTALGLNQNEEVELEILAESNECGRSEIGTITCTTKECSDIMTSIEGLDQFFYCVELPPIELIGMPVGGTFLFNGVENTHFDPSQMGLGGVEIIYEYVDTETGCVYRQEENATVIDYMSSPRLGCSQTAFDEITFEWDPDPAVSHYNISYRINEGNLAVETLNGEVLSFVVGGLSPSDQVVFDMVTVGLCGESLKASNDCQISDCPDIEITFNDLDSSYCQSDGILQLEANPSGGTFSLEENAIENQIDLATLEMGIYTLTYDYTDPATNCNYTQSVDIELEGVPEISFISCGTSDVECVTFVWSAMEEVAQYTVFIFVNDIPASSQLQPETTYTICDINEGDVVAIEVKGQNQCGDGATSSGSCIYECAVIEPTISNLNASYCEDAATVLLEGEPIGGTFTLEDGTVLTEWNPAVHGLGEHLVTYTFVEIDGCEYQTEINIETLPLPNSEFTVSDTTVFQGETIILLAENQEGATYIWSVDGMEVGDDFEYVFSSETIGVYSIVLEIVSADGCKSTSEPFEMTVEMDTAIDTHPFFDSLQIQPNPAHDFLQISLNTPMPTDASLQWYNAQGQLIDKEQVQIGGNGWSYSVSISEFAVGVYYLYLQTDRGMVVEKVLIVR